MSEDGAPAALSHGNDGRARIGRRDRATQDRAAEQGGRCGHLGISAFFAASFPFKPARRGVLISLTTEIWQGSGSSIPETFVSEGEVTISLSPQAFVLFTRAPDAP